MAPAACNKGNDRFGAQSGGSRPHTRASRPAPIPATSRYGDRSAQIDPKQPLVTPTGFNADDPESVTAPRQRHGSCDTTVYCPIVGSSAKPLSRWGNARMMRISRRQVTQGAVSAAALTLCPPSIRAQDEQILRFVAEADLKVLDPVWTTAYITRNHAYLVYDTLFGTDENLRVQPQMVNRTTVSPDGKKYTFTLRDGLRWHDGQPVVSEDCVESLKRWGKNNRFGQLLMAHTGKIAPVDKKTFTLELSERFGLVLEALGKPSSNVPFMMPARIASTSPDEQIRDIVGSGPFKFVREEWQPGEQVVYLRNADYVPRDEGPSGSTGGKK